MGFRAAALSILPLLLAPSALAQDEGGGQPVFNLPRTTQPPVDPNKQGPELDVFRGAPVTVLPPPPVVTPTVPPAPAPATPAPQAAPRQQAPSPARPQQPAAPAPRSAPPPASTPAETAPAAQPALPAPEAPPRPTSGPAATPPSPAAPPAQPPLAAPAESTPLAWIVGGLLALGALLSVWLLRRRRTGEAGREEPRALAEESASEPAAVTPVRTPEHKLAAPTPAPAAPRTPTAPATADRPWIDLTMEVRGARLSLMGATIIYVLTLRNRGERAAEDLLIRSLIANADAGQQALLGQFFAGSAGLPTHSVVSIAPGEEQSLTGELRLLPDQIAPVQMGDRSLLIPLVAFDAQYRWSDEGSATGAGRTGRAFIVGQEKTPPADRLAPFRLDQGPRQYRAPGSRATALELAS